MASEPNQFHVAPSHLVHFGLLIPKIKKNLCCTVGQRSLCSKLDLVRGVQRQPSISKECPGGLKSSDIPHGPPWMQSLTL